MNRKMRTCQKWWKSSEEVVKKWWGGGEKDGGKVFGFARGCSVSMFGLWEKWDLHKICRYLCGEIYTWNLFGFIDFPDINIAIAAVIHIST